MKKYLGFSTLCFMVTVGMVQADEIGQPIIAKPYVGFGAGISYSNDLYDNAKNIFAPVGYSVHGGIPLAPTANIYMGAEIGKNVEVRVGYLYLGRYDVDIKYQPTSEKYKFSSTWTAWAADFLLKIPTANEHVSFFGKLGVASTRADERTSGDLHDSYTENKTTLVPGVGIKNEFSEMSGFAVELNYYPKLAGSEDDETYSMLTFTGNLYFRF